MDLLAACADEAGDHEDRSRDPFSSEQRESVIVKISVAVVKGDCRHRLRAARTGLQHVSQLVEGDKLVPFTEPVEVAFEHRAGDEHRRDRGPGSIREALHHVVVTEHHGQVPATGERADPFAGSRPTQGVGGAGFDPLTQHLLFSRSFYECSRTGIR